MAEKCDEGRIVNFNGYFDRKNLKDILTVHKKVMENETGFKRKLESIE